MKLRVIHHPETKVYVNLALEKVHVHSAVETKSPILKFWKNEKSVILGRTQDIQVEVNQEYCNEHKILMARRESAGGAVYQDLGNLNVSVIFPIRKIASNVSDAVTSLVKRVIETLDELNYSGCKRLGNSGITHGSLKISGAAQYHYRSWLLHHFTLLQNINLHHLENSLKVKSSIQHKKNMSSYHPTKNLDNFEEALFYRKFTEKVTGLLKHSSIQSKVYESEMELAKKLASTIYSQKHWIFRKERNFKEKLY